MKKAADYITTLVGAATAATGLVLTATLQNPQGLMLTLPYVCIGLGCGAFGHGLGNIISKRAMQSDPALQKKVEIEEKDERNIAVSNRAKARAFDLMTTVFGALAFCFALMNVELRVTLLLVAAYLFVQGYAIYCRIKYEKEM